MERKEKELPTLLFFLRRCPTNNTVSPFSRERERERERRGEETRNQAAGPPATALGALEPRIPRRSIPSS